MDDPTQQEKPKGAGHDEHDDGHGKAALEQLAKAGNEEAAERSDDVPGRSLSPHVLSCRDAREHQIQHRLESGPLRRLACSRRDRRPEDTRRSERQRQARILRLKSGTRKVRPATSALGLARARVQGHLGTFDIPPEGKHIVLDRSRQNSDIVLIELPKQC